MTDTPKKIKIGIKMDIQTGQKDTWGHAYLVGGMDLSQIRKMPEEIGISGEPLDTFRLGFHHKEVTGRFAPGSLILIKMWHENWDVIGPAYILCEVAQLPKQFVELRCSWQRREDGGPDYRCEIRNLKVITSTHDDSFHPSLVLSDYPDLIDHRMHPALPIFVELTKRAV